MGELLQHPAVQGGLAPFAVALAVAFALFAFRLGGLSIVAALGTAIYLIGGVAFPPVSAQQKVLLLALVLPVAGVIVDLAFKTTRGSAAALGTIVALLAIWVGWNVLKQKELVAMFMWGAGVAAVAGWITAGTFLLRDDPVRAGASALTLGLGLGISAILSASGSYGQYAASIGAGAGAFLLVQMLLGRVIAAGATFTLSAGAACGLIAAGALLGTSLPWYAVIPLALIPMAVQVPLPRSGIWLQAVVASLYGGMFALAACLLSWPEVQRRFGL